MYHSFISLFDIYPIKSNFNIKYHEILFKLL